MTNQQEEEKDQENKH